MSPLIARPGVAAAGLLSLVLVAGPLAAAPPPGYYNSVIADTPAQLRTTLHAVIDDHTRYPYSSSGTDTWIILEAADQDPNNASNILDVYRNRTLAKFGGGTGPYNREHTWPNSLGFPNDGGTNYPYTDCHHLFLSDVGYNSDRGNKPYGNVTSGATERVTDINDGMGGGSGVFPGNSNWFTASLWQTWNGRKGDVARAMFYMDIRYEGGTHGGTGASEPNLHLTDNAGLITTTGSNASSAYMGLLSVLLEWHAQDPPDDRERDRNDVVASYQGNRNPFIDHPEWANALYVASTGPTIVGLEDVPDDEGGFLEVFWQRNSLDVVGSTWPIDHYVVQRLDGAWVDVATIPATGAASYATTIPTPDIASPGNPTPNASYRVVAVEEGGTLRPSTSASAFSIDNLPPPAPVASLDDSGLPRILSWDAPAISDLDEACVYRGTSSGFTPGAPLACVGAGPVNDGDAGGPYFYRIRFFDVHGNAGPYSDELAPDVTGVPEGPGAAVTRLAPVTPNPFTRRAGIAFSLAEAGPVRVEVFTIDGRRVRTLLDADLTAGLHEAAWDGTDDSGARVGNGLYVVRMSGGGVADSRKVLLVR